MFIMNIAFQRQVTMIVTAFITARITFMVVKLPHKLSRYSQLKQLSANMGHDRVGETVNQYDYICIYKSAFF
jgi:hypothetical protein